MNLSTTWPATGSVAVETTFVASLVLAAAVAASAAVIPQNAITPADRQIRADVQRKLAGFEAAVTVDVQDRVVTLSGMVPSLWVKEEAVRRALKASHIQSLVSDLTIAKAEHDAALAKEVGERIRKYDRYSVYDIVEGRVNKGAEGTVLTGAAVGGLIGALLTSGATAGQKTDIKATVSLRDVTLREIGSTNVLWHDTITVSTNFTAHFSAADEPAVFNHADNCLKQAVTELIQNLAKTIAASKP
jgi:osmotically-inducible protein OsmY